MKFKFRLPRPWIQRKPCLTQQQANILAARRARACAMHISNTNKIREIDAYAEKHYADLTQELRAKLAAKRLKAVAAQTRAHVEIQSCAKSLDIAGFDFQGGRRKQSVWARFVRWVSLRAPNCLAA